MNFSGLQKTVKSKKLNILYLRNKRQVPTEIFTCSQKSIVKYTKTRQYYRKHLRN